MHKNAISIVSLSSLSALGLGMDSVWRAYADPVHCLSPLPEVSHETAYGGRLPAPLQAELSGIRKSSPAYRDLDPTVIYAMAVSRDAVRRAGWKESDSFGVNIGSSRGATTLFESYLREYEERGTVGPHASPSTTLGNIASWVAQDLASSGPELSHSVTCSTALHSLLNGVAWIRSGLADRFVSGGSEAPLTAFTMAQMKALKIYSRESGDYPCRAGDPLKSNNSMVLGEGAAVACLEKGNPEHALATVEGIGYATEPLRHGASLSADALCLQRSMKMALGEIPAQEIDIVVMHAPGTLRGDRSEYNAIEKVFGGRPPALTTNKWKLGHTLGASGMLSLELAVLMLRNRVFVGVPYLPDNPPPDRFRFAMVNAVGFGGNAVSVVVRVHSH